MSEVNDSFDIRKIESDISKAASSFHKLLIVVGESGAGKTTLLRFLSKELQIPLVNLGLILSRQLLGLTTRQRKLKAADMVTDILDEQDVPRLAVDNTEIIFEPTLKLSPLGLLKSISRNRLLIWSWNGHLEKNNLIYAYPGHPEHQRISAEEFTVITV